MKTYCMLPLNKLLIFVTDKNVRKLDSDKGK